MIEKVILEHLKQELIYPVYCEMPAEWPATPFCVIVKTGGSIVNHIARATLSIRSYAPSMFGASLLNEQVKIAMLERSIDSVYGVHLNSDFNFTDTTNKEYRYQAVFDLTHEEGA